MPWVLNDQEFKVVRSLAAGKRYTYLVNHVADEGVLWSLKDGDGWVLGADDMGRELHPVWPHVRFAEVAAVGPWASASPAPIDVREWLDVWTPAMVTAGRGVAVFPSDIGGEAAIDPAEFAADLVEELSKVE